MKKLPKSVYQDDLTTIYCGDSQVILPLLPKADLVLADPPYGLGKHWRRRKVDKKGKSPLWKGETPDWDKIPVSDEFIKLVVDSGNHCVIWGGNNYNLGPSKGYFIWDKMQDNCRGSDCEVAWHNLNLASKVFRMTRIEAYACKALFPKVHPCEKPVQLFRWCLRKAKVQPGQLVIDPFMGSGNSAFACRQLGIKFIGIETEMIYCKEAIQRVNRSRRTSTPKDSSKGFGFL